ncbi:O-acyltransferase like protein-like isoform X2 [Ostrinia furnacalis]|uniref:O-acyltransferase like protein-like isoform X2 n=1 Tax=Ostrinia furnacalis TaxID=93504 RepID=UPI00103F5655|nr:O-acyltransferase like protein-like isoform X2 [Ostrinia furnacalis]
MVTKLFFFFVLIISQKVNANLVWDAKNPAIDQALFEEVLDPELCDEHVNFIVQDTLLLLQFIDAGIRIPRGILQGNTLDLGNYHQCLGINHQLENSELQGKYCLIQVPLSQQIPELPGWTDLEESDLAEINARLETVQDLNIGTQIVGGIFSNDSRLMPDSPLSALSFRQGICIPKTCTTQQAVSSLLFNISFGFEFTEEFCRLPNDKPWVAADYIAVVLFSLIGFLTIVSTMYDVFGKFVKKNEFQKPNYIIFSLYTNCRRLLNFSSGPDALHCLDGIRSLAMLWVLIGHTFSTVDFWSNPLVGMEWQLSLNALWLVSATITVDTFFMLSGLLVVYTTVGKLSGIKLIKNIHLFYLNRLLRIFPVLATGVLIEASLLNHLSDGPYWVEVSNLVERCRGSWWTTLLYIQNYYSPTPMCLGVGWYLAIDMQLHILSPLVLFWVLNGKKTVARVALAVAFLLHLSASTAYNFVMEFPSTTFHPGRTDDVMLYVKNYYINTLTRATPFMVGMIVGYILACSRGKKIRLSKPIVVLGWLCTAALLLFVIYCSNPIIQPEWDNQIADSLYNSFIRGTWAAALGWLVFACVHGYGGPVNWFLSLSLWKLPARLSFAMYILHFGLMVVVNSSALAPRFFSVNSVMYTFLGHFCLVFMMSFVVVLFIDAPFSVLVKKVLSGVPKGAKKPMTEPENTRESNKQV